MKDADQTDVVWRLREQRDNIALCEEAADMIEQLRNHVKFVIAVNRQMNEDLNKLAEDLRLMQERYE